MSEENVEIVRTVYERWSEGDLRASVDLFDRHVLLVLPPAFGPDGLDGKGVLAIEDARQDESAKPTHAPPRLHLEHGRLELHLASAGWLDSDRKLGALDELPLRLRHEWIPLLVAAQVREHIPDPLRGCCDLDRCPKLPHRCEAIAGGAVQPGSNPARGARGRGRLSA
jgi:hypothetical protein